MKKIIIIFLVIIFIAIIGGGVWYFVLNKSKVCTQEAKVCPDGTTVGRTGKNCEFAECPVAEDQFKDWKTFKNEKYGWEVKYPLNWSAEHFYSYSEFIGKYIESNTFKDQTGNYILSFAVVPENSNIRYPNGRTGVGYSSIGLLDETVNIGGVNVSIEKLGEIKNGKEYVKELWFDKINLNGFKGKAELGYMANNETFSLIGKPETEIAKQILSTFKFTD